MNKADDIQGYIAVMENIMNNLFTANVKIKEVPHLRQPVSFTIQSPLCLAWEKIVRAIVMMVMQ